MSLEGRQLHIHVSDLAGGGCRASKCGLERMWCSLTRLRPDWQWALKHNNATYWPEQHSACHDLISMPDLDLQQFKVGSLPSLFYIPDFLSKVQQDSLEQKITSAKAQWMQVIVGNVCITDQRTVMLSMRLM